MCAESNKKWSIVLDREHCPYRCPPPYMVEDKNEYCSHNKPGDTGASRCYKTSCPIRPPSSPTNTDTSKDTWHMIAEMTKCECLRYDKDRNPYCLHDKSIKYSAFECTEAGCPQKPDVEKDSHDISIDSTKCPDMRNMYCYNNKDMKCFVYHCRKKGCPRLEKSCDTKESWTVWRFGSNFNRCIIEACLCGILSMPYLDKPIDPTMIFYTILPHMHSLDEDKHLAISMEVSTEAGRQIEKQFTECLSRLIGKNTFIINTGFESDPLDSNETRGL